MDCGPTSDRGLADRGDRPKDREALDADAALRELERNAGSRFCPRAIGALVGK